MPSPGRRSGWSLGRRPGAQGELRGRPSRQGEHRTGPKAKVSLVIYSFTKREWRERELAWDSTRLHVEREVALRVASNRRAGDPSPFSRAVFEAPERNVGIGKDESELVRALERAQLAQDRGHLARRVFVDPVQAHERIDQERPAGGSGRSGGSGATRSGCSLVPDL